MSKRDCDLLVWVTPEGVIEHRIFTDFALLSGFLNSWQYSFDCEVWNRESTGAWWHNRDKGAPALHNRMRLFLAGPEYPRPKEIDAYLLLIE